MQWQSHQGENICDLSMVSLVARWPVFWPVFDLRICSWMANPIGKFTTFMKVLLLECIVPWCKRKKGLGWAVSLQALAICQLYNWSKCGIRKSTRCNVCHISWTRSDLSVVTTWALVASNSTLCAWPTSKQIASKIQSPFWSPVKAQWEP